MRFWFAFFLINLLFISAVNAELPLTPTENFFLKQSNRQNSYAHERVRVIETNTANDLGQLTALRFIEWIAENPNGVIGLSMGQTLEYFIKFISYYKKNWNLSSVQKDLKNYGVKLSKFPDTTNLKLVQLDEFYPIDPKHYKSFANYIDRYYIKLLNLKSENILTININAQGILKEKGINVVFQNGIVDLSLLDYSPQNRLEIWRKKALQEAVVFCENYEKKIRSWGGIGFMLSSVGYNSDIAFNNPGTEFTSLTRLVNIDYSSSALAAKNLGGIEFAKHKAAITVGLGTISLNPDASIILVAIGKLKSKSIKNTVEKLPSINYPATIIQNFPNSRVYVTNDIAGSLSDRQSEDLISEFKSVNNNPGELTGTRKNTFDKILINIALSNNKLLSQLTSQDLLNNSRGKILLDYVTDNLDLLRDQVRQRIVEKIEAGLHLGEQNSAETFLHTAPHHDDLVLGYYPLMDKLISNHKNYFAYLTSGFNSVTDSYVNSIFQRVDEGWITKNKENIFNSTYVSELEKFSEFYKINDHEAMQISETIIALKNLISVFHIKDIASLTKKLRWLKDDYFPNKIPGDQDRHDIKILKGFMRESESDRVLNLNRVKLSNISHMRSKFYSGKTFNNFPKIDEDVVPILKLYQKIKPTVITVADAIANVGPSTDYKVLQTVSHGLRMYKSNQPIKIIGYRNTWGQYKIEEANKFVPVTSDMQDDLYKVFMSCFSTQKTASFPNPFFKGDFATYIKKTQREQLEKIKILLGENYFKQHKDPRVRNAIGFVFLKEMTPEELFAHVEELKPDLELDKDLVSAIVSAIGV